MSETKRDMSEHGTRVLGYGRQSQQRPGEDPLTSLSLNGQADRFREECEKRGWVNLGFITDHDLKGEDPTRPGIAELKERCARGDVDAVWVVMLNRFSNDYIWQGMTWRELKRRGVKHLISFTEGTIDDEFLLGIHGLVSGKRITEMKVHLKGAFARRARDGGFPVGPTPIGYARPHRIRVTRANGTSYERETGEPAIDPEGAAFVRELADRFDGGESLQAITDDLIRRGPGPRGGTWTRTTVKRILQSPIYVGDIVHHGVVVAHDDKWQILPREQWERIQARFGRAATIRRGERESWLEGLVVHACGQRMYYQRYTGRSEGHGGMFGCRTTWEPPAGRCGLGRRIIGATLLERVVLDCLARDLGARRSPSDAVALAQELAGGKAATRARKRLDDALQAAKARWTRNHDRFSQGKLPPDVMDAEDARLAQAEADHAAAVAALPPPPDGAAIAALCAQLAALADLVPRMTGDELRAALDALGTVVVSDAGVSITYHVDEHGYVLSPSVIAVPKGGKGWR